MGTPRVTKRLREAARAIAPRGAQVSVAVVDSVASAFTVSIQVGAAKHELVAAWAGEGWPSDVKRVLRFTPNLDAVAAHALSVGAREILEDHNVGWFDETGAANLVLTSGLMIVRDGATRPSAPSRGERTWSDSTIAVAEAILCGSAPQVDPVQSATGLSRGATANALALLNRAGLLERSVARGPRSGRRVTDYGRLLDQYTSAVASTATRSRTLLLHRLWDDPLNALTGEIAPTLEQAHVSWAVTGAAASMLLAPLLSNITVVELYVEDTLFSDSARLAELLAARPVDRGQRIEVRPMPTTTAATAAVVIDRVRCAPSVRVYADLVAKGGRFAEAAQHLREVRIDARTTA